MIFNFKKSKITVDCFTYSPAAYELYKRGVSVHSVSAAETDYKIGIHINVTKQSQHTYTQRKKL